MFDVLLAFVEFSVAACVLLELVESLDELVFVVLF